MSKLKIYNNGQWVDPTNISVYQGGAWNSLTRVNYRNNNAWEEVWPLEEPAPPDEGIIDPDWVLIKFYYNDSRFDTYGDGALMKQFEIINPKPDYYEFFPNSDGFFGDGIQNPVYTSYTTYGAIQEENSSGDYRIKASNPKPVFFPERPIGARVGNEFLVDSTNRSPSFIATHERVFDIPDDPNVLQPAAYAQLVEGGTEPNSTTNNLDPYMFFVDVGKLKQHYVNSSNTNFDYNHPDLGIGERIRLGLFLAWDIDFVENNDQDQVIEISYEFYKGGTPQWDRSTATVLINNFDEFVRIDKTYNAGLFRPETSHPESNTDRLLDYYHNAHYIDILFNENKVEINQYDKPSLAPIFNINGGLPYQETFQPGIGNHRINPRSIVIQTTALSPLQSSSYEQKFQAVCWIDSPKEFYEYLDGPRFDSQGQKTGALREFGIGDADYVEDLIETDVGNPGMDQFDGRDILATRGRFLSDNGVFNTNNRHFYPMVEGDTSANSAFTRNTEFVWWLHLNNATADADKINFNQVNEFNQYIQFDFWQYKYDNPDKDFVTIKLAGYIEKQIVSGSDVSVPCAVEFKTHYAHEKLQSHQDVVSSLPLFLEELATITKAIDVGDTAPFGAVGYMTDPNDLTLIADITINLNTGEVTFQSL